jgi:ABC-type antimicrobial peptide transport system permease subunit
MNVYRKHIIISIIRCCVICTITGILGAGIISWLLAWVAKFPRGGSPVSLARFCELKNTMNTAIWVFAIVFIVTFPIALLIDHWLFYSSKKRKALGGSEQNPKIREKIIKKSNNPGTQY